MPVIMNTHQFVNVGSKSPVKTYGTSAIFREIEVSNHSGDEQNFSGVVFQDCHFLNLVLTNCNLEHCKFINCMFESATTFSGCNLESVQFINCQFDTFQLRNKSVADGMLINSCLIKGMISVKKCPGLGVVFIKESSINRVFVVGKSLGRVRFTKCTIDTVRIKNAKPEEEFSFTDTYIKKSRDCKLTTVLVNGKRYTCTEHGYFDRGTFVSNCPTDPLASKLMPYIR